MISSQTDPMPSFRLANAVKAHIRAVIVVIAVAVGIFAAVTGFGTNLDLALRDARDASRAHSASGSIAIVEIDAKSLAVLDDWPWPRRYHAQLVDQLRLADVRLIAFDVDFSAHSNPVDDAAFAGALKRSSGSVVLPTFQQRGDSTTGRYRENLPIAALRRHAFLASVNVHPNVDGQVRSYSRGVVTANTMRPSLGAMLAETSSSSSDPIVIDQAIDPQTIPRFSFVDVIRGKIPKSQLEGKRIVIGATAIELGDRYAVPRHGVIPGVVIQAMAGETLLQRSENPGLGAFPAMIVALIALALAARSKKNERAAAVLLGAIATILIVPLALEMARVGSLEIAPALVMLIAGGLMLIALTLARTFRKTQMTDAETGLPNAIAFTDRMRQRSSHAVVVARIARYGEIVSLIGAVNGADLIRRIAERLAYAADDGEIFRFEASALSWSVPAEALASMPDRLAALAAMFRAPIQVGSRAIDVSLTYGVATDDSSDGGLLAAKALVMANRAAEQGLLWDRYDDAVDDQTDWKLSLLAELDHALADGQIWVAYQPKSAIATGTIIGCEALVRWKHPTRGPIAPDHFIPTIEQSGRIFELTAFVLCQAVADLGDWRAAGHNIGVAVNLSASLLDDERFVTVVTKALALAKFDPSHLTLEITESAAMADPDAAIRAMARLRKLGINLSIDDYGTGQSTLTYLKRLPATEIKIDKSFVSDLVDNRSDQILVRSTIALAHDLGFKTVAEGIETPECLALLAELGCDVGQGWHIGKPVAAADFVAKLAKPLALAA